MTSQLLHMTQEYRIIQLTENLWSQIQDSCRLSNTMCIHGINDWNTCCALKSRLFTKNHKLPEIGLKSGQRGLWKAWSKYGRVSCFWFFQDFKWTNKRTITSVPTESTVWVFTRPLSFFFGAYYLPLLSIIDLFLLCSCIKFPSGLPSKVQPNKILPKKSIFWLNIFPFFHKTDFGTER